jgi:protein-tyrosine phosphatase
LEEGLLKHKLAREGVLHFTEVDSCGTAHYHIGEPPDPPTVANAHKNGITLSHSGRQLTIRDLQYFDYILPMDGHNLRFISAMPGAPDCLQKVTLFRTFDKDRTSDEVPDPYYGGEREFQEVFEILDHSAEGFVRYLLSQNVFRI